MKVYFLSGLGTDERVFTHIRLPEGFEVEYISYERVVAGELLEYNAYQTFLPYKDKGPFILIGLSLSGIMASEIATCFHPVCTILFGSVPVWGDLPPWYRMADKLGIHRLLPPFLWKITATCKQLLTLKSPEDRRLMRRMTWESDTKFIGWAVCAVLEWYGYIVPSPCYQIHGTRDEIFPIRYTRPTHIIRGGGHLLVMTHPEEVNAILQEILVPYSIRENT